MKSLLLVLLPLLLLPAPAMPAPAEAPIDASQLPFMPLAPEDILAMKVNFQEVAAAADRAYLGVKGAGAVGLGQLPADVIFIEFMNVHCPACRQEAPILNEAHALVQGRADLRNRVKFLSVSVGNTVAEVEKFRKDNRIPFPVLPDPLFAIYDSVGSPEGLPFLIVIALRPLGGGQLSARGHLGWVDRPEKLIAEVERALTARAPAEADRMSAYRLGEWRNLKLNVGESYLHKLLADAAGEIGMRNPAIEQVEAAAGDVVYRLRSGGRRAWAKVAGRVKICNACENIYFIILFDDQGKVANFTPIKVTKGYNLRWEETDIAFMRKRLVGHSVLEQRVFNPEVDSVTSATMSADLIFDTVRRLGGTYQALKGKGLIP